MRTSRRVLVCLLIAAVAVLVSARPAGAQAADETVVTISHVIAYGWAGAFTVVYTAVGVMLWRKERRDAPPEEVPAGWYPDPSGVEYWRWWDGSQWTDHTNATSQQGQQPASG